MQDIRNTGSHRFTSVKICSCLAVAIYLSCFFGALVSEAGAEKKQTVIRVYSANMVQTKDRAWVRYIGLSAPGKGREFYRMCRDANIDLVQDKEIRMEFDELREESSMVLAYVFVGDIFVNAELIRLGYALAFEEKPNTKYSQLFSQMQQEARENRRGLWAMEDHGSEPFYIGSKNRKEFHRPGCSSVKRIPFDKRMIFRTQDEALDAGFRQHWRCCPLFMEQNPPGGIQQ